jgi:hypothetical protein
MEGLRLVPLVGQDKLGVLDVNRAILKRRWSEVTRLDGRVRETASQVLEKLEIQLSQYYQATLTKKMVKIQEAMSKANSTIAQYDRFFSNETRKSKWQVYAKEQYTIDLEKVNTIQVNSMRMQAWRQLSHIGMLRSEASNKFGNGQSHKAKKVLARAKKLQEELHQHCEDVQKPVPDGFKIDPNDFNPDISKLEKSDDPLFKSELVYAKRARSQLVWLRSNYYQANKMRAIGMRKKMRDIEEKYMHLSNLKPRQKVVVEKEEEMSQLDILTKVKGLRKIEMGHIDVYCRSAGTGSHRKNVTNACARDIVGGPWSRPKGQKKHLNKGATKEKQPKITSDMSAEDWQAAIDWAQKNQAPIRLPKEVDKVARRAKVIAFRKLRAEKLEKQATTVVVPLKNKRHVATKVVNNSQQSQNSVRLDRVLMPYSLVNVNMKVNDSLGGYYVFSKGIEATVSHCDYQYSSKKVTSNLGRVTIHDDVAHKKLDKLIQIIL